MKARFQHPFGVPKQSPVLWAGIQPPFTVIEFSEDNFNDILNTFSVINSTFARAELAVTM